MKSMILGLALSAAISTLASAQTTEFYVVQDAQTKRCMVVDKKPVATETKTTIVANGTMYKTRTEAEAAIKTVKVCM